MGKRHPLDRRLDGALYRSGLSFGIEKQFLVIQPIE